MKLITKLGIATAGIALTLGLAETKPAQALSWDWSFNGGAEAGTFDTNGTFADTAGSFNFVIDASTFNATSSTFAPSVVGANFDTLSTQNQGVQGFLWNGTTATQFYRNGGTLTNGSNFFSGDFRYIFGISGSPVAQLSNEATFANTGFTTLTLTPTQVPFGFSTNLSLGIFGAYTLGNILRRKAKAAKETVEL